MIRKPRCHIPWCCESRTLPLPQGIPYPLSLSHPVSLSLGVVSGQICSQNQGSKCLCSGCTSDPVGSVLLGYHLPSPIDSTALQDQFGEHPGGPKSNQKDMKRGSSLTSERHSMGTSRLARATVPGSSLPSWFTVADFNGLSVESKVLRGHCLFDSVIHTLPKARKLTSHKIYLCTWKAYMTCCEALKLQLR